MVAKRREAVDDSVSVAVDGAAETKRRGEQPPRFAQGWWFRIGTQMVIEGGMLGYQSRGADGQCAVEQRQHGELGRGGEQARLETRWVSLKSHGQRFRVGEPAAFFCAGCAKASR